MLAVALVLLIPLARHLPTARSVRLDVTDPGTLTGLELTWLEGDEALRSTVLRFGARQAPAHIDTAIRVTDGTYRLQLRIERTGGVTHVERRVSFAPDVSLVVVPVP